MTAKASYKKGKSTYDKEVWIISVHTSAGEIMANDRKRWVVWKESFTETVKLRNT